MDAAHPDDMDGRNVEGVDGSGVKTGIIGEVGCTWPLISNERKSLVDVSRGIIGHLDRTVFDVDTLHRIASSGCYLEWDLFGNEGSYYPLADIDMPNDAQRLDYIKQIADAGVPDVCNVH